AWYAYIYDRVPLPFWLGFCRNITENYFTHTIAHFPESKIFSVGLCKLIFFRNFHNFCLLEFTSLFYITSLFYTEFSTYTPPFFFSSFLGVQYEITSYNDVCSRDIFKFCSKCNLPFIS